MWYYVQQWKVWKGVDATRPTWQNTQLVCATFEEAQGLVEFLERNNPTEPFRVRGQLA